MWAVNEGANIISLSIGLDFIGHSKRFEACGFPHDVGALRFQDEGSVFQRAAEDLRYLRGRATSLGGLRPKCTVVDDDGRLSIGKFPSVGDDRAVTKGEVLALRLATTAGINAAEASLVESEGTPVTLIRRFNRVLSGGRLIYVSAATMLGVEVAESGEHGYTELVDALRMHGAAPQADTEELWRRIAFSILVTNVNNHLHNHGFLHVDRGQWRLAQAFDVNPFPDRVRELKTWVSEDAGPEAARHRGGGLLRSVVSRSPRCYFLVNLVKAIPWRNLSACMMRKPGSLLWWIAPRRAKRS